jgi:fructose-bisphosphate aldolase, class II
MTLVSILGELKKAQAGHYALPCFLNFEMLGTEGTLRALEEKRAPSMIGIYTAMLEKPMTEFFAVYLRAVAQKASVPISLILDHGGSFEQCLKAFSWGFTDVMYDASKLPLEENIANTRLVVRAAHAMGGCVEAELGHVGSGAEYTAFGAQRKGFTNPDVVERFVAETGVDILAVAIGSAHGVYNGEPNLDIALLSEIRRRVGTPLSLHGGTGLSTEQFQAAIAAGITKVNIFTDLGLTAGERMLAAAKAEKASYFSMTDAVRTAFYERCCYYLDTFGATGKA